MTAIAFIGLGHMGAPMATNLLRAGYDPVVYDLVGEQCEKAAETGLRVASSAAEAAADASVIITMLPEGQHVHAAYTGERSRAGILTAARPGSLFVDCSTISVQDAQDAAQMVTANGHRALDAPVSGGVVGAENGTLAFMVGGAHADLLEVLPLLEVMGKRIVHCGGPGLGQAAKLCNNLILGISQIAVAEAFVLAEHLGLDDQVLFDVVSDASGQCWALTTNCPVPGPVTSSPANHAYAPGFAARLMAKDLGLVAHAIERTGVDARLGTLARERYDEFIGAGGAEKDFSAIISMIRDAREESGTSR